MDGAAPEVVTTPASAGPMTSHSKSPEIREITVIGQDVPTPEVKTEEVKKDTPTAGSEEPKDLEGGEENRDGKGRFQKRGTGVQERIDELTRSRREAEREVEYWKIRANGGQAQPAQQQTKDSRPQRESFQSDDDYQEALVDYRVEQRLAKRDQETKAVQQQSEKANSWVQRLEAARTEISDFNDVMETADAPVAAHVADLIMEHDHGPKVMYNLAQNPEMIEKLNNMPPGKAAFEIERLASQFNKPAPASSSKPAVEVSKAPKPAAQSVGAGRSTQKDPGDMDMDEYKAYRKSQGASWAH